MSIVNKIILEAKITDTITSRTTVTFQDIVTAVLNHKDGKVTDANIASFEKDLGVKGASLKKYIDAAKTSKFLNADGSVADKYKNAKSSDDSDEEESNGSLESGNNFTQSLDAKVKAFKAPQVTNNNQFSTQVFSMLSLMEGQAATSGIKNSLMLTGDPGVGKCLAGDQEIIVNVDKTLYDKIIEITKRK